MLKKLFEKMGNSFRRFMRGRYGNDELNIFLLVLCTVFAFLSFIPQLYGISILTLVTLIWTSFRSLSKNHVKRRKELDVYRRMKNRMSKWFSLRKDMWREKNTHLFQVSQMQSRDPRSQKTWRRHCKLSQMRK